MKFLINWLINHLLLSGTLFAAGGSVLDITSGGETGTEITEESADTGEEVEQGTEEGEEGEEVTEEGKETESKETPVDWKTVPPEVKAHLQAIAKENPKLGNALQNAVYTSQTFLREFPGGLKEAQGLKASLEEVGGIEEVKQLRDRYQTLEAEQEDLDSKARAGDSSVLDNLIEIAGDGFGRLMPTALDRWLSLDGAGYSHVMSKIMVSALQEGNVVADLNLAARMLKLNNPEATKEAVEAFQRVTDYINKVGTIAAKAPDRPKVDPELTRKNQELDTRQEVVFRKEFAADFAPWRDSKIQQQLGIVSKGKKFNDFQYNTLQTKVVEEIQRLLVSDPDYKKNVERLYKSRNMAELLKFTKSRTERHVPDAVKNVYRHLYSQGTLGTKKPGTEKVGDKKIKVNGAPAPQGWVKVSADKAPTPDEIDNSRTDFQMKFKKQAILKSGKKVYWGDRVPK